MTFERYSLIRRDYGIKCPTCQDSGCNICMNVITELLDEVSRLHRVYNALKYSGVDTMYEGVDDVWKA